MLDNDIILLTDWAFFWNPSDNVELLAGFSIGSNATNEFKISPPLIFSPNVDSGSFFFTAEGEIYGFKDKGNPTYCSDFFRRYTASMEAHLAEIEDQELVISSQKSLSFLKDCILLSVLLDETPPKFIQRAILYPCEGGGFTVLDEQTKLLTSLVISFDLENNLILTESGSVYAYDELLVADLTERVQLAKAF